MKNVLIISGHPNLANSVANAAILEETARLLPDAEIRRLDSLYPDFRIDVAAEQAALLKADIIVWQFPFHWYSLPALMKKWLDDVFVFGFAHGDGAQLAGKKLLVSFTTGAPGEAYQRDGFFRHTVADYLPQFETTATLCQLDYQEPLYTTGIRYAGRDEAMIQAQRAAAKEHAERLVAKIQAA